MKPEEPGFDREGHEPRAGANGAQATEEPPPWLDDEEPDGSPYSTYKAREREREAAPWDALATPAPSEWFTKSPKKRDWFLRDGRGGGAGLLPRGKVGQLIAAGGSGKTMALVQLAVAVATGTQWLGTFDVVTPGRVLPALGEEDAEEAQRRLYRARRASNTPTPPHGSILVIPLAGATCAMLERDGRGNLTEGAFLPWLRERLVGERDWRLIVVDPLSRFAGPDAESDNAAATRFVQALESLVERSGGANVLDAHHTNKLSRNKQGEIDGTAGRGSTGFFDGARWECGLGVERLHLDDPDDRSRLGEVVTWANTKTNYSRKAPPLLLRRDLDNGGALVPLDETDLVLVEAARGRDAEREAKQAGKKAELTTRESAEDEAVLRAVRAQPAIPTRRLIDTVQAIARCGEGRATVAIARVLEQLDVREGPRHGPHPTRLHYLKGSAP